MFEETLKDAVGMLRPGAAISEGPLCILPLQATRESTARYVLLDQAISRGRLVITEVSDGGSVPYLQAVNAGPWPVLIFDGEELVGAKQNRIANATIMVGVGKTILPVSCVEQGRWSRKSHSFSSGAYASHPRLRQAKERQVRDHLKYEAERRAAASGSASAALEPQEVRAGHYHADQSKVWAEVGDTSSALGVRSRTSAMADAYETRRNDLEHTMETFAPGNGSIGVDTVGAVVFLGGRFVCLDLVQPAKRFVHLYPKLLRGYALESHLYNENAPKDFDAEAAVLRLLAGITQAEVEEHAGVDLGYDLRLEAKNVSGSGLVWRDELIQLSVFPVAMR